MKERIGKCSPINRFKQFGKAAVVLTVFLCIAVIAGGGQAQAQTGAEHGTGAERGLLRLTRKLGADRATAEEPAETYWDRDGGRYVLESWEIKEIPGHRRNTSLEKQVVYTAVEGAEGLPESISVTEEVSGAPAEGELHIRDSRIVREEWQDGFSAPVMFHSYGADAFQVGEMVISGADVLSQAVFAQKEILAVMGLSPDEYRIHSMDWDGEAFADSEGQMCRQATAMGQKLVRDIEITYEGEVSFMEPESYEMEMVYRLAPPSVLTLEEEHGPGPESALAAAPVPEELPLWYWVRSGFVITVGAGLIGIGVGMVILMVSWLRRRRWEKRKRVLPRIKG